MTGEGTCDRCGETRYLVRYQPGLPPSERICLDCLAKDLKRQEDGPTDAELEAMNGGDGGRSERDRAWRQKR